MTTSIMMFEASFTVWMSLALIAVIRSVQGILLALLCLLAELCPGLGIALTG